MNLDNLSTPEFWIDVSDGRTKSTPLVVVLPSGRAKMATSGHLALISDALYTHEIVLAIDKLSRRGGMGGISILSVLDIDYYDMLAEHNRLSNSQNEKERAHSDNEFVNSNLLLLATADINIITKLLLEKTKSAETYSVGYKPPYEDCIIRGGNNKIYAVTAYPNSGVLAMYKNPWATGNRVALFCGGILATGTLGASLLLLNYLRGEKHGNNTILPESPVKILSSSMRDYRKVELLPTAECFPPHELRNVTSQIVIHE